MTIVAANWSRRVQITEIATSPALSGYVALLTESNLPTEIWTTAINGGGDLRVCLNSDGSSQLPLEVVSFDTASETAVLWVRFPTFTSGDSLWLFYGKAGETQPTVTDTFGRNSVWVDYEAVLPLDSSGYIDVTGNSKDGVGSGALSQTTIGHPFGGVWTDFSASSSAVVTLSDTGNILDESNISVSAWVKRTSGVGNFGGVVSNRKSSGTPEWFQLNQRSSSNEDWQAAISDSGGESAAVFYDDPSPLENRRLTLTSDGSSVKLLFNGVEEISAATSSDGLFTNSSNITIGNYFNGTFGFTGYIGYVLISKGTKDANKDLAEYNNQSSPNTFWSTGTPEDVGVVGDYYLQFDGVNDLVDLSANPIGSSDFTTATVDMDYIFEFKVELKDALTFIGVGTEAPVAKRWLFRYSDGLFICGGYRDGELRFEGADAITGLSLGNVYTFRISSPLGTVNHTLEVVETGLSRTKAFTNNLGFEYLGRDGGSNFGALDLYYLSYTDNVNPPNSVYLDPSATNGIGSILPDTVGGIDGTLVNFPTDNSQWVLYDAGGGGLVITSVAIASAESFGTPVLTAGAVTLSPEAIASAEALGNPTISQGATFISPLSINTEEFVGNPIVTPQGVIITPVEIPTEALVGNPEVSVGLAFILPEEIATQEFVGEPDIDLILKQIFPDAIASLLSVGRPLVLGGDRIIIPIESRVTWNAVAKYLRELVFTGADNDVIMKWLRSEGFDDAYNDNWEQYLKSAGFLSGAMSDKYALWRRGINGVDPWILSDGTWDDSKIWQDLETWRDS